LSEITINFEGIELLELYGHNDSKLDILRKTFPGVLITSRGNAVKVIGEKSEVQAIKGILEKMAKVVQEFGELNIQQVQDMVGGGNPFAVKLPKSEDNVIVHGKHGQPIKARTKNQKKLVDMSEANDIVFAMGPAGTGKTYTAVALAVKALKARTVQKIILTRPAVEAGENLGFLPGDLKEKIDPYLRPLYDALDDMLQYDKLQQFMTTRVIEIAPLAFMRGRTLNDAFIILDEAQNTTDMQLKMFLTRLGPTSKCIITGDMSQVDLPPKQRSGLVRGLHILKDIEGIGIIHLSAEDVVRHRLVKEVVKAYDRDDARRLAEGEGDEHNRKPREPKQ
jgi:phosphate starvation-inducible PhoH-like protein